MGHQRGPDTGDVTAGAYFNGPETFVDTASFSLKFNDLNAKLTESTVDNHHKSNSSANAR